MKKILLLLIIIVSATSCSTSRTGTSKSLDIVGPGVIHKPVIADLDVKQQKISVTMTFSNVESMANARNEVLRKALEEHNADVLIEPSFTSETTNRKTDLTVKGWPATYKNFRQIQEDDIKYLEIKPNYLQKAERKETMVEEKKKGGKALWITLGALLLGGLVIAGVA